MDRVHLLAAEIFGYSLAHYADHLGVNIRFDRLMPERVRVIERAADEGWSVEELARKLEVDTEDAAGLLEGLREAREVVDAPNPAESFRNGVRVSIRNAIEDGLSDAESIDRLVVQICYRAADLAFLLEREGSSLSRYSERLRREPDNDEWEADEGGDGPETPDG
jgi:hypothetical protein